MQYHKIEEGGLKLEINIGDSTASIIGSPDAKDEIFVPRSIYFDSKEYPIKSIKKDSFQGNMKLTFIKFPEDSEISFIEEESFARCSIKSLIMPIQLTQICKFTFNSCENLKILEIPENSSVTTIQTNAFSKSFIETLIFSSKVNNLEEGWCSNTKKLTNIVIPTTNKYFSYLDEEKKIDNRKI